MYPRSHYLPWAMQHYGKAEYDLASSGMTPLPLARVLSAASDELDDPTGWQKLPRDIARHLDLPGDEVIATLGTAHALWLAYASSTTPGDEILVEEPAYEPLLAAAAGVGAKLTRFARTRESRYTLDPKAIAGAMTEKTRLVAVSNLHNPTGTRTSDEVLAEIARVCRARSVCLVVDEVYAPFDGLASADGVWRGSARRLGENVIAVASLTKCYGLGANRFGWLAAPSDAIERARDAMLASCVHLPLAHAQHFRAALAALPTLSSRARELLADKRDLVARWMSGRSDVSWSFPEAGLFGMAVVHRAAGRDLLPDVERAISELGLLVAAGSFFGVPDGLRVAWSIDRDRLPEGLTRLGRLLDAVG